MLPLPPAILDAIDDAVDDAIALLDVPGQVAAAVTAADIPGQVAAAVTAADIPGQVAAAVGAAVPPAVAAGVAAAVPPAVAAAVPPAVAAAVPPAVAAAVAAAIPPAIAAAVESGTWVPVITPDPSRQAHTVAVSPIEASYTRVGDLVTVSVLYVVNLTNTLTLAVEWGDFITLPFPPAAPFTTQFEATGVVVPAISTNVLEILKGGVLFTEAGGSRLNAVYTLISIGGTQAYVQVVGTYNRA